MAACPGVAPSGGGDVCEGGYWLFNSSLALDVHGYEIEGRILIDGDFNLTSGAMLRWKGFAKKNDSFPQNVPAQSTFVLSFVNVTGTATLTGSVVVEIDPTNLDGIVGPVDPKDPKRAIEQPIFESQNAATLSLNTASVKPSQSCRKVSMSVKSSNTASGRQTLSAYFAIDDSNCNKKSNKLVQILVPIFVILVVFLVILIVVLATKTEVFKIIFRPFVARKRVNQARASVVTMSSEEAAMAGPGPSDENIPVDSSNGKPNDGEIADSVSNSSH